MGSFPDNGVPGSPVDGPAPAAPPGLGARFKRDLGIGLKAGLQTFWELARVMIPAYGATLILERLGVIEWLARAARPLMALLGLPGDAAVPLIVGYVLNIYAAVGSEPFGSWICTSCSARRPNAALSSGLTLLRRSPSGTCRRPSFASLTSHSMRSARAECWRAWASRVCAVAAS